MKRACEPKIQVKVKFIKINEKRHPPLEKSKQALTKLVPALSNNLASLTKPLRNQYIIVQRQVHVKCSKFDQSGSQALTTTTYPAALVAYQFRGVTYKLSDDLPGCFCLGAEITLDIPHCWSRPVLTCFYMGGEVFLLIEDLVTKVTFDMVLAVMSFCMTVQPALCWKTLATPILCALEFVSI